VLTTPGHTIDAYAEDVVAVARAVDADILVGNSLGSAVALRVTLETDWRPNAMVLTGAGPRLPVFDGLLTWLEEEFDRAIEFLHGRDRLFHSRDASLGGPSRETMRQVGRRVTRRDFRACHQFDVRDLLPAIDVPTLALCGEHDKLTPRESHEVLAQALPHGEFALVADAAHLAMLERPSAFNRAVEGFLGDVLVD